MKLYKYLIDKKDLKIMLHEYEIKSYENRNRNDYCPSCGSDLIIKYYFDTPTGTYEEKEDFIDDIYVNELYRVKNYCGYSYVIYALDCIADDILYDMIKSKKLLKNHELECQIERNNKIIAKLDDK